MLKMLLLLIFISVSCAEVDLKSKKLDKTLKRRNLHEYNVSIGLANYFLPELPSWANFSMSGQCHRDSSVKYVDMNKLRRSYDLTYEHAIHIQLMFNYELNKLRANKYVTKVTFEQEEKLFYNVSQKVQENIKAFKVPRFKRVHLIWIDPLIETGRLKTVLNSTEMELGHPVFLSLCLSRLVMEKKLIELGLNGKNIRLISSELLSPYDDGNRQNYEYNLYINNLFSNDKELYFYVPKGMKRPFEVKGNFKIKSL